MAIDSFATLDNDSPSSSLIENSMLIYNRFFSIDACDSLNFDPSIRNEVEENICSENGTPSLETFDRAKHAAHAILDTVSLN